MAGTKSLILKIGLPFAVLIVAAAGMAAGYCFPVRGPGVDRAVSAGLSLLAGQDIEFKNARIEKWSRVHFGSVLIRSPYEEIWLEGGPGTARVHEIGFGKSGQWRFSLESQKVHLAGGFRERLPVFAWLPRENAADFLFADVFALTVVRRDSVLTFHVTECRMKGLEIQGGLRLRDKVPVAMHAFFTFAGEYAAKMGEEIAGRLFRRGGERRGLRMTFRESQLTIFGQNGPFFRAEWQP